MEAIYAALALVYVIGLVAIVGLLWSADHKLTASTVRFGVLWPVVVFVVLPLWTLMKLFTEEP